LYREHSLLEITKDLGSLVLDLKILMYQNADEIEKLKKIKADSNQEMVGAMKQLKELLESRDSMQQELVALREVRDAAQEVAEVIEIPEGNENELLSLAGKLCKVPEAFEWYVSTTTRQYVGHVLGLVKSYWPTSHLDALGKGAKADCTKEQFSQYLEEISMVAN
jgi:chromosome segregation ATPase